MSCSAGKLILLFVKLGPLQLTLLKKSRPIILFILQCSNVPRMTVREFADQICLRARDVDPDLIGTGLQRIDSDGTVYYYLSTKLRISKPFFIGSNSFQITLKSIDLFFSYLCPVCRREQCVCSMVRHARRRLQVPRLEPARRHRLLQGLAHVLHQRRLPGTLNLQFFQTFWAYRDFFIFFIDQVM